MLLTTTNVDELSIVILSINLTTKIVNRTLALKKINKIIVNNLLLYVNSNAFNAINNSVLTRPKTVSNN